MLASAIDICTKYTYINVTGNIDNQVFRKMPRYYAKCGVGNMIKINKIGDRQLPTTLFY